MSSNPTPRSYRPRDSEDTAQVYFRVPISVRDRLVAEAVRRAVSTNYLAVEALGSALDKWEKQKLS